MNEPTLTITGNLVADPEIRYTNQGTPVANYTIATTPRVYNKQTNTYEDGTPIYTRCTSWRQDAENITETLRKGQRVIATGKLTAHTWQDKEGNNRTTNTLEVEDIGPSIKFTHLNKNNQPQRNQPQRNQPQPQNNPWGQPLDPTEPPF